MKKAALLFVIFCFLLAGCATGGGTTSTAVESGALPPLPGETSSDVGAASSTAVSSAPDSLGGAGAADEALVGSWELVLGADGETNRPYYRLTFGEDGSVEYMAGWYMSEIAELMVGSYTVSGGTLTLDLASTMAEEPFTRNSVLSYEMQDGNLILTLTGGEPMHAYQHEGTTETYTPYLEGA